MSVRTTLLTIGAMSWLGALACWLRARWTGGRGDEAKTHEPEKADATNEAARREALKQVALFVALGLPFVVAGAFYTSSSYPGEDPPPTTPIPIAIDAPPTPSPEPTPAPPLPEQRPADHAQAVLAAQRAAVARYPALGVADSPFNRAFLAAYARVQRTDLDYFADPEWPLRLADEVAGQLGPGAE